MNHPANCPHCGVLLDDGDVLEVLSAMDAYKTRSARDAAECYGWTPETPVRFSRVIGIYNTDRDCTTHYICPDCKRKI